MPYGCDSTKKFDSQQRKDQHSFHDTVKLDLGKLFDLLEEKCLVS